LGAERIWPLVDPFRLYLSSSLTEILGQFLWQWGTRSMDLPVFYKWREKVTSVSTGLLWPYLSLKKAS